MSPLAEVGSYRAPFLMQVLDAQRGDNYHDRNESLRGDPSPFGKKMTITEAAQAEFTKNSLHRFVFIINLHGQSHFRKAELTP